MNSHLLYLPALIFFFEIYKGMREITITTAMTKKIKAKQLAAKHANQPLWKGENIYTNLLKLVRSKRSLSAS